MDLLPIRSLLQGKTVLITGAGGSIGSELARQVSSFGPSRLLLLDHAEFNLYQIDQELRKFSSDADFISPVLVDIKDAASLHNVFELNRPQIVLHAAAYKHVHLVEHNPCPSILNNVLGTRNLLEMCSTFDVDTFVMISTDKAVNPVGVMGATKRVCELMVTETGRRLGRRYCSVRFGNVLGSSGSLIPLLKDQIEKREPVTITHPDMTRYFMLIPEAVSLVLRASTLASPGDISLLDMGKPVKIVDIARSLISLMGHSEEESPIVFTGLRPGEKLFEELYMCGNEIKTDDPDILVVPHGDGGGADWLPTEIDSSVVRLLQLAATNSPDSVRTLHSIVRASFVAPSPQASSAELAAVHERTLPDAPLNQLH